MRSNETNRADGRTQANQRPGRRAIWLETGLGGGVEPMTAGGITDEKEWGLWQSKNLLGLKVAIGKVKKLDKWVPHELTANQKNCHFQVLSPLILCDSNEPFLDKIVMCDKKWIFMTTGDNQCSSWTEKELQSTSQGQTCTKKRSWPLFGGLLPV